MTAASALPAPAPQNELVIFSRDLWPQDTLFKSRPLILRGDGMRWFLFIRIYHSSFIIALLR